MILKYYKNYLNNLARTANEEYRELHQETIKSNFDNTTLLKTVQEEQNFDFNFKPIEVWVGTITDAITNTEKDVKDYRSLYFEDCNHKSDRGKYYYFDNNYWIIYESPSPLESQAISKVRRCNNKLKWIDKQTGELIEYPCILDYSLSSPNMQVTKKINTANSHVTVIVQGNENTLKLEKNQRFIFNKVPYRYIAINNYMQNDYVTEGVNLLFLDCYLDMEQSDDNTKDSIANTDDFIYKIKILEDSFEQVKGFQGTLHATVTLNGEEVNRNITWSSSNQDIVYIDNNGNYELVGNNNESCNITARIDKSDIFSTISISIKETLMDKNDLIIEPLITELGLYDNIDITANLYKDGIKQDAVIECIPSNLDESYFTLTKKEGNVFNLRNNRQSKIPLKLTFKYNDYQEDIEIKLTSLF